MFLIGSLKELSNPLAEFIEALPYTETLVDGDLLDMLSLILIKHKYTFVANVTCMLLLSMLADKGICELRVLTFPSILGKVLTVQRITQ